MKRAGGSDDAKRRAAASAVAHVEDGMVVGLGTGSTAAHAIRRLGERVDAGLDVVGVPTSFQSRELAREVGVPVASLPEVDGVDVAIDGADAVALGTDDGELQSSARASGEDGGEHAVPSVALVKGGGAAHAREKVVDAAAEAFHVVVDPSKVEPQLSASVPIEVLPAARSTVADAVRDAGGAPALRRADRKDGPVVTDNGNLVLDCDFGAIENPAALADTLASLPGVLEHGLFVDLADVVHVGDDDGVTTYRRQAVSE